MKVFMIPPNSLILYDLVERFGHQPLSLMGELREHVVKPEVESPPLNLSQDDIMKGLKYAGIEVPSGVRGRLAIWGPMVDQADAAVVEQEDVGRMRVAVEEAVAEDHRHPGIRHPVRQLPALLG